MHTNNYVGLFKLYSMKKFCFALIFSLFFGIVYGQEPSDVGHGSASGKKSTRFLNRIGREFGLYIGLNNWTNAPNPFQLQPAGSRFVALSWRYNVTLVRGESARLRLGLGPEIAWNNFMLDGDRVFVQGGNSTPTTRDPDTVVVDDPRDLRRSKLVAVQANLPVVLALKWKSGVSLAMGGYVGTRLDSYTAVKPAGGDKDRDHGKYNLSPWRWGLTTELGWNETFTLFGRYEPSPLFRSGLGPELNVWVVGIRL